MGGSRPGQRTHMRQQMKLEAKHDVEAPAAFVFAQLADFEGWERAAMRRGADVTRLDTLRTVGPGMTWTASSTIAARTAAR